MSEWPDFLTKRHISHDEAREVAGRLINSHFRKEPHARASIPAKPDYDDDLLMIAYIRQQQVASPPAQISEEEIMLMLQERGEYRTDDGVPDFVNVPVEPSDRHLHALGYAPGGYMAKCHHCNEVKFNLDKRAVMCRECAVRRYKNLIKIFAE